MFLKAKIINKNTLNANKFVLIKRNYVTSIYTASFDSCINITGAIPQPIIIYTALSIIVIAYTDNNFSACM